MNLRNVLLLALVAALLALGCSGYGSAPAAPVLPAAVGSWTMTTETPLGPQTATLTVSGDASALTATMSSDEGELELAEVTWSEDGALGFAMDIEVSGQPLHLVFSGMVDGDSITGSFASDFGDMTVTGTRVVE